MYQLIVLGYLNTYKMTYLLCGTKSEDLCWVVCKCSTSYEHRHSLRILHSLTLKTLELLQFSPFHMFTPHGKQNNEHQCFSDPFIVHPSTPDPTPDQRPVTLKTITCSLRLDALHSISQGAALFLTLH